ncbi:MAG: IMP cyclohydrolase [Oscillospiraceae bacterium]|nr:IMP cyclohydrolase [Oscillospiraceae bacterium]
MKNLDLSALLRGNCYPGRGILLGKSPDGSRAVAAYFIMGRSENSRNRVFELTEDGIRTRAFDESKMTDPSLIIYHPVRVVGEDTVITNGDQTDTVRDALLEGKVFAQALKTRTFEPAGRNYTPRISGLLHRDGSYALSILKSADGDPASCRRFFFGYEAPLAGQGHFIHTYMGDGQPLPSFQGEPEQVAIPTGDAQALADSIWVDLNGENKVSLFVRTIDLATGESVTVLKNKQQGD